MSELGEWVVVPGFDEALQREIAKQTDPLIESIGQLRMITTKLLERVEALEALAVEGKSYTLNVTCTEPTSFREDFEALSALMNVGYTP